MEQQRIPAIPPRIGRVPASDAARVRSLAVVQDGARAVEEVVRNALEHGGATRVDVAMQLGAGAFRADDNGRGVSRADMEVLGERHHSAGARRRGETLASIACVARLRVVSRARGAAAWTREWEHGEGGPPVAAARGTAEGQRACGTSVSVSDLFGRFPVRRTKLSDRDHAAAAQRVRCLALLHRRASVLVRAPQGTLVRAPPAGSLRARVAQLFPRAGAGGMVRVRGQHLGAAYEGVFGEPGASSAAGAAAQLVLFGPRAEPSQEARRQVVAAYARWARAALGADARPPAFVLLVAGDSEAVARSAEARARIVADAVRAAAAAGSRPLAAAAARAVAGLGRVRPAEKRRQEEPLLSAPAPARRLKRSRSSPVRARREFLAPTPSPRVEDRIDRDIMRSLSAGAAAFAARRALQRRPRDEEAPNFAAAVAERPPKRPRPLGELLAEWHSGQREEEEAAAAAAAAEGENDRPLPFDSGPAPRPATVVAAQVTRAEMERLVPVGQVARKFLVAVAGRRLVAVDQHAADERCRLEALEARYGAAARAAGTADAAGRALEGGGAVVALSWEQLAALAAFRARVEAWGFRAGRAPGLAAAAVVTRVPEVCGTPLRPSDLAGLLDELHRTNGSARAAPPALHALLCSKSCRSAIMFGDELDHARQADLLVRLARCRLPFICAHGRPSVAPVALLPADPAAGASTPAPPRLARVRGQVAAFAAARRGVA